MAFDNRKLAGALLFIGVAEFMLCIIAGEAFFPTDYVIHKNAISDLGVGATALLFNGSIILFGLLAMSAAYLLWKTDVGKLLSAFIFLGGIGGLGVGFFPETNLQPHLLFAFLVFIFGPLAAIASFRITPSPLKYLSAITGVFSLAMLVSFVAAAMARSTTYYGFGMGGMERMFVYPLFIWILGFAGFLMSAKDAQPAAAPKAAKKPAKK